MQFEKLIGEIGSSGAFFVFVLELFRLNTKEK